MKSFIIMSTAALAMALSGVSAHAGGWGGGKNSNNFSSGLINVSPTVRTGNLNLLNGTQVLNGSPIASGNVISGILSGNSTGNGLLGAGVLNGSNLGILGGNSKSNTSKYSIRNGRR